MIKVTAIANGYYGGKLRVPGEEFGIDDEQAFSDVWMTKGADAPVETRHVNTGGTDGVVGAEIPKKGAKLSAAERIASAKALSGRDDITTAKQADEILAAAGTVGSENDDRSRDQGIDQGATAPLPDADETKKPAINVAIVEPDADI